MPTLSDVIKESLEEVEALPKEQLLEEEIEEMEKDEERRTRLAKMPVFYGGKEEVEIEKLEAGEEDSFHKCFNEYVEGLKKVSTKIATTVMDQRHLALTFTKIAKAVFPEVKRLTYPSQAGQLGILPIIPAALKYADTPSADYPCYTSYDTNRWTMSLTADTPAYFLGDGSNYYKASPTTNQHSFIVILKDGVVESGSSPTIDHMRFYSEPYQKYGVFAPHVLTEAPIEDGKTLYQYNTHATIAADHLTNNMFGFMPRANGVKTIKLLGFVIYEHDFLPNLTAR